MGLKRRSSINLGTIFNAQHLNISYLEGRESFLSPKTVLIEETDWNENFMPVIGAVFDAENNKTKMMHDYGHRIRASLSRALSAKTVDRGDKTYRQLRKSDFRAVKRVVADHLKALPEKNASMTKLPIRQILQGTVPSQAR